ncbi:MAG: ubiquitin-like domain-containing protein [Anaerolineae bacterium]
MLAVALALLVLTAGRNTSLTSVQVTVDGESQQVHTHQRTVGSLLRSLDIHWDDADIVIPDPATRLGEGMEVKVLRARRAWVQADGRAFPLATHARTPAEVLRECGLEVGPSDQARVNGKPWSLEAPLPPSESPSDPLRVALRRAVSIEVEMDGVRTTLLTAALTVGEALRQEGISLYLGDLVRPGLGTPVTSGLKVFVERSLPVQIQVDGRTVDTRTRQDTVGQVLAEEGIHLAGRDYVSLPLDSLVHPNLRIRVVRVKEVPAIEQESIPYETLWRPNSELELDQQRVEQAGEPGLIKRRYRAAYEDGELKARTLEETWVDREPITRLIAYGTKIVSRPLETPEGTVTYWRKVRMLATSYTAATAGKDEDHPEYGITYLGWAMKKGIVAVDPTVIPLRSRVYVPGYGVGVAGDTGGSIKGRRIDLGYDKDNLVLWYRWVDVYLLDPPPPRSQIRWVLPNWPTERK